MNADPAVMEFFPGLLDRRASEAAIARMDAHFDHHGFGLWATEVQSTNEFIGFVGLNTVDFEAPFTPAVEVSWRLARLAWGNGYATKAGKRALGFAFDDARLAEVVSFTVPANMRSRATMERLGFVHDAGSDFDHPKLPQGHILSRHVLYRKRAPTGSGQRRRIRCKGS
jgi:RimJ/RimL family protein N-acetyltransferase